VADAYAVQPPSSGFVNNLASPTHPGAGWSNLFEGQLEWKPTSAFDAWFKVQNFQSDNAASYGVNPDQYPEYPPNSAFGGNCPTVNGAAFSCLAPAPTALLAPNSNPTIHDRFVINDNTVGHVKLHDDWTFSTQLTYTMPWASLEYIGGYSQYNYQYQSDFDGGPRSPAIGAMPAGFIDQTVFGNQWQKWYQNELQLKSPSDQRLKWLVGVFQYWNSYNAPYNESEPNNFALDHPTGGPANPNRDFYGQVGSLTDKAEAIYGNVDYDLTDTVRLTGGFRYNWDHKDGAVHFIEVFDTAGIFFSPALGSLYVANVSEAAHVASSDWTGKIGAEWRPDSSTMVYGSLSKGFKSAGLALADFVPVPVVAPETLYDAEVGVKKTFGSQLLVNADVYYYDYHNLQQFLSALNPTTGLVSSTLTSAQRARTYGFELESVWSPTADFQLTFNYSYLNARFTKFDGGFLDSSQLAPGCVGTGTLAGPCSGVFHTNLNGNAVPQSPANKVTINPVYTLHFPIGKLTLSGTYAFIDKQYYSVFSTPNFLAPSYSNVDLRLLFQPTDTHLTLILFARNATDARQIVNYSTGYFVYGPANLVVPPAAYPSRGQVTYYTNPPRTYGAELQLRF
jgi:iron complex outermembrane receptor protein